MILEVIGNKKFGFELREAAITLRETFIPTFNRLCRSRQARARAHPLRVDGGVCARYTRTVTNAGLPGCARTPMVRIPKVKDSLSN